MSYLRIVLASICILWPAVWVSAQTARINGFVTDAANGSPLVGTTVALFEPGAMDQTPVYGTITIADGVFLIDGIQPDSYILRLSFVGYETHADTLALQAGQTRTFRIALEQTVAQGDEVEVVSERPTGAARVTAGHQQITPRDLEHVPAPDLSADLTSYLTTLPGVVSTGDRGGQLFIRGGEPTQNLTMLDKIYVFQPFHVLGFYSAFPADLIERVDLYAGGYGVRYAGRLSSVIDVSARAGNLQRLNAMASVSPYAGTVRVEGPLMPGYVSLIGLARMSLLDRTAEPLYGEDLPFRFYDMFGKFHAATSERSTLSVTGLHTYDEGTLVPEINSEDAQEIRWTNSGASFRWVLLPQSLPIISELTVSHAMHEMQQGTAQDTVRSTQIRSTRVGLNGTFLGQRTTVNAGWDAVFSRTHNEIGGLFQNVETPSFGIPAFGFYIDPEFNLGGGLSVRPGLRLQLYNVRHKPYLEPRLRVVWDRRIHHLSGAVGLYHQQVIGLNDRRDAASVFTAWTGTPRYDEDLQGRLNEDILRGRIGTAWHGLLGYRSDPTPWLEFSVEGFYKALTNLFISEWTALPQLSTRLLQATGRSYGIEARVELRRGPVYAYVTYGLSNTEYAAEGRAIEVWYGMEELRYRPAHDRRHQINTVLSSTWHGFELNLRWAFGSGLPYTRPLAFDGFALVDDVRPAEDLEHSRRVIYERPFDSLLPTYHRLDVSLQYTWHLRRVELTLQGSIINAYDRRNIFYVDVFTLERQDQLPFIPSLGIKIEVD